MPKSAKKRKEKAADFSKAKLKLGKGKQIPSNVINTSFKTRSIALPSQSINAVKNNHEPKTKRNLTFDELLIHLKHYSPNTRRDGILGLRELLGENQDFASQKLTALINACARLIGDEDAVVRRSLLSFFGWLLPRIPQGDLRAHGRTLLLFTTSAQTHIFPEIRIDSIRFIDILLEQLPESTIDGWSNATSHGGMVLLGYLGLLNAGTTYDHNHGPLRPTSPASVVLSTQSKLVVFKSLENFLRRCLRDVKGHPMTSMVGPPFFLKPFFSTPSAYESFEHLIPPEHKPKDQVIICCDRKPNLESAPQYCAQWTLGHGKTWVFPDALEIYDSHKGSTEDLLQIVVDHHVLARLTKTLQPTLVTVILDHAASTFAPAPAASDNDVEMILTATRIIRSLYWPLLQLPTSQFQDFDEVAAKLEILLGYLTAYFPFHLQVNRDNNLPRSREADLIIALKSAQVVQEMNVVFCELVSLLTLANVRRDRQPSLPSISPRSRRSIIDTPLMDQIFRYIISFLRGQGRNELGVGRPLTPGFYTALSPSVWAFLYISSCGGNLPTNEGGDKGNDILGALLEHGTKVSATSAVKPLSLRFIAQLILLNGEPHYRGRFEPSPSDKRVQDWLAHLPQCLWEAGSNYPITSEIILRLILRLHQRNSKFLSQTLVAQFQSKLTAYFNVDHSTRGRMHGPYYKVSPRLQRLVLDVVFYLCKKSHSSSSEVKNLSSAVQQAVQGTQNLRYWLDLQLCL